MKFHNPLATQESASVKSRLPALLAVAGAVTSVSAYAADTIPAGP